MYRILLSVITMLLLSCDPTRRINMINESDQDAEICWIIKEDSLQSSPLFISNSDTVKFILKSSRPYNKVSMSMGIGNWTEGELNNFVDDLKSLQLKWLNKQISLDSTEQIKTFLSLRRKGLDNGKIYLVVK